MSDTPISNTPMSATPRTDEIPHNVAELAMHARKLEREVREMEEALEWIIAPDRPIGSDAEMVYVMQQIARKILKAKQLDRRN